jgi:hypothetical protein
MAQGIIEEDDMSKLQIYSYVRWKITAVDL